MSHNESNSKFRNINSWAPMIDSWEMCVEIIKTFYVKFFPLGSPQNGMSHHWRLLIKHLKGGSSFEFSLIWFPLDCTQSERLNGLINSNRTVRIVPPTCLYRKFGKYLDWFILTSSWSRNYGAHELNLVILKSGCSITYNLYKYNWSIVLMKYPPWINRYPP